MNWLRKLSAMVLCLMLCLGLFSGCGSDVYIAKLALSGTAGTFDPQFAENQNSILVASNVFEGLLVEDPDGGLHPGVAEGYTVSSDGRTYTFQLREDACWSDGSAVTADDFVFAFRRLFGPGSVSPMPRICSRCRMPRPFSPGRCSPRHWASGLPDDHTLVLTLEKADSGITTVLAQWYTAPCKESFFTEQKGRYGLEVKSTPLQWPLCHQPLRCRQGDPPAPEPKLPFGAAGRALRHQHHPGQHRYPGCLHRGGQLLYPGAPGVGGLAPGRCHHRVCRYHLCPGGEHQPQPAGK